MRLRHILSTCAVLPLLTTACHPVAAKTRATARANPAAPSTLSPAEMATARASVSRMIDQINIPYQQFTLPNGLRVIVHSDRSTPIVHVGIWYDVGSKHEPAGRSGFAHLFEHLMFNGSENVPGDYLPKLSSIGAQVNGNTSEDRTHYYEVVPTQALDRALFMESDRMGHLLGGISQATLDRQRGVVQNEKRNASSSPIAVVGDMQRAALYPQSHPYGHSIIGSMKDLNAATLADVGNFFRAHYGPNNALIVLSGDVDLANAKRMVTKYFGDIPAGPRNVRPDAGSKMLARTIIETTTAPVATPMIVRAWPVPGKGGEALTLEAVAATMASAPDSPFQRHLVEDRKLFQYVSVANLTKAQAGEFTISGAVSPGVDAKVAAAALDRELALYLERGASADLLTGWVTSNSYNTVRSLEALVSRGSTLGEYTIRNGSAAALKTDLRFQAALTPAAVTAAARHWLTRPRWELTVTPGTRVTPTDDAGIDGSGEKGGTATTAAARPATVPPAKMGDRGPLPDVGPPGDPRFPGIEHARLANGIPVIFSRWGRTPFTQVALLVDGGALNEPAGQAGTMDMMYSLLTTSFAGMDEDRVRKRLSLSGISLSSGSTWDFSNVALDTSDASLETGLTMMHQALTAPAFPTAIIERMKREQRDARVSARLDPGTLIAEAMLPLLDAGSPYNRDTMYGDGKAYEAITRDGIVAAYRRWLRPEHARLVVVSDRPLGELLPALNRSIGAWKVAGLAQPVPAVSYRPDLGKAQIVLIDMPDAVQAIIAGGQRIPAIDRDPAVALNLANSVLGSGFSSRLNMNLREDKHWTYGTGVAVELRPYSSSYTVKVRVQQDKTGPAIAEVMKEVRSILADRPITAAEFDREKAARLGSAVRLYSSSADIVRALKDVQDHDRPDDYPANAGQRIRVLTLADANAALRSQLDPSRWSWVIAGNASIIRPQLDALGLPVRVVKAADVLPPL